MTRMKFGCHGFNWAAREKGFYDLERVAKEIRQAGFSGLDGLGVASSEDLVSGANALAKEGLKVISVWSQDARKTLRFSVAAGCAIASEFSPGRKSRLKKDDPSRETLAAYAEEVERRAAWMAGYGVSLALHPHLDAICESEAELDFIMSRTRHLGLMLETGHQSAANHDLLRVVRKHGRRIKHVHLKDWRQDPGSDFRKGHFCELGRGNKKVPFRAILKALDKLGYEGWCAVEQDHIDGKVVDSMKISRRYLKSLGY